MRTAELIASHGNTDFDAFAAMVAAGKLYPEAAISLGGAVNRNVREFQALYADLIPVVDPGDVDRDGVRRLILVDTVHANRIGDLLAGGEDFWRKDLPEGVVLRPERTVLDELERRDNVAHALAIAY